MGSKEPQMRARAGREEGLASCAQQGTLRLRGGSRTDRIPVPGKDKGLM